MNIEGKVAVVTGAASGIGLAIAEGLIKGGAKVLMVDVNPELRVIAKRLHAYAAVGDVTRAAFRDSLPGLADITFGEPASIGVFSAGITCDALALKMSEEAWDAVLTLNLKASVFGARGLAAKLVQAQQPGRFVFIGSISSQGNMGQVNYAASKAALVAASKTLNMEWKKYGISTAVVHPGFTATPMVAAMPAALQEKIKGWVVSGEIHTPESVAQAVLATIADDSKKSEVFLDQFKHAA